MSGLHALGHPPFRSPSAACRGVPTDVMFPVGAGGEDEAKAVCAPCPVRLACLEFALAHGERYGVWGGMTPDDRWVELRVRRGETGLRRCAECGKDKPLSEFRASNPGKYRTRCKPCHNVYVRPVSAAWRARKKAERAGVA